MPAYYDITRATTTSASGNTCATHVGFRSASNMKVLRITSVTAGGRPTNATAGAAEVRIATLHGTSSGGAAATFSCTVWGSRPFDATVVHDGSSFTSGDTTVYHQAIPFAQTGGANGWVALEPDDAYQVFHSTTLPDSTNLQVDSFATATSAGVVISIRGNQ